MRTSTLSLGAFTVALILGCGGVGGKKAVNDADGRGTSLTNAEVAVSDDGATLMRDDDGGLTITDDDGGVFEIGPIGDPYQVAFDDVGSTAFVLTHLYGATRIVALDLDDGAVRWDVRLDFVPRGLSPAGDHVAVWGDEFVVLHRSNGYRTAGHAMARPLFDVVAHDDDSWLFVHNEDWATGAPEAVFGRLDVDGTVQTATLPNCAARIQQTPDRSRAFVAPPFCALDPISVVDLGGSVDFVRNLPGFGPVSVSADGTGLVGFYRRDNADAALFEGTGVDMPGADTPNVHLLLARTDTLDFELVPWGEQLPLYTVVNDPPRVLAQDHLGGPLQVFDVTARTISEVEGPAFFMDLFAVAPNANKVLVLDRFSAVGLYLIDLRTNRARSLDVGFVPVAINLSPDGQTAYLRHDTDGLCLFDIASRTCAWIP
jgi:DNA-binding beta-propeller fold protein YncE